MIVPERSDAARAATRYSAVRRWVGSRWPIRHLVSGQGAARIILLVAAVSLLIGFTLALFGLGSGGPRRGAVQVQPDEDIVVSYNVYEEMEIKTAPAAADAPMASIGRGQRRKALWVVRHSLRGPDSIDDVIATALDIGADTLFVQVNGRMEAYYRSALLPPASEALPDFDALDYILRRAHAAGMEVHAWINAFTAGMLAERPVHPDHVLNRHPDWVTVDRNGRSLWDYGWEEAQIHVPARMLDPGLPAVQQFVVDVVLEVLDSYDIDGVHLDYVRYPSRRFGYHPESIDRFAAEYGFNPMTMEQDAAVFVSHHGRDEFHRRQEQWDDWRRRQVTSLVERIGHAVASRGGRHVFSVAVGADADDAITERLQNWPAWVERDLVDALVIMAYSADTQRVAAQVRHAVAVAQETGVPVYAGIGAYLLSGDADLLLRQVDAVRTAGAAGVAVFSYDTLLEQPHFKQALPAAW